MFENQVLISLIVPCSLLGVTLGWALKGIADEYSRKVGEEIPSRPLPSLVAGSIFIFAFILVMFPVGNSLLNENQENGRLNDLRSNSDFLVPEREYQIVRAQMIAVPATNDSLVVADVEGTAKMFSLKIAVPPESWFVKKTDRTFKMVRSSMGNVFVGKH